MLVSEDFHATQNGTRTSSSSCYQTLNDVVNYERNPDFTLSLSELFLSSEHFTKLA
jgi:hypothetical protein